jgi:hypothetical protein
VFFPAAASAISFLQASRNTCVMRAQEGTIEHDDFSTEPAPAPRARREPPRREGHLPRLDPDRHRGGRAGRGDRFRALTQSPPTEGPPPPSPPPKPCPPWPTVSS